MTKFHVKIYLHLIPSVVVRSDMLIIRINHANHAIELLLVPKIILSTVGTWNQFFF